MGSIAFLVITHEYLITVRRRITTPRRRLSTTTRTTGLLLWTRIRIQLFNNILYFSNLFFFLLLILFVPTRDFIVIVITSGFGHIAWFLLYNIYVRVSPPPRPRVTSRHAPEGGVAMPSLSEGNLDLKIGYLDHGFPQKPEISGL